MIITVLTPSWTKKYDGSWERSIRSILVFWRRTRSLRYRLVRSTVWGNVLDRSWNKFYTFVQKIVLYNKLKKIVLYNNKNYKITFSSSRASCTEKFFSSSVFASVVLDKLSNLDLIFFSRFLFCLTLRLTRWTNVLYKKKYWVICEYTNYLLLYNLYSYSSIYTNYKKYPELCVLSSLRTGRWAIPKHMRIFFCQCYSKRSVHFLIIYILFLIGWRI